MLSKSVLHDRCRHLNLSRLVSAKPANCATAVPQLPNFMHKRLRVDTGLPSHAGTPSSPASTVPVTPPHGAAQAAAGASRPAATEPAAAAGAAAPTPAEQKVNSILERHSQSFCEELGVSAAVISPALPPGLYLLMQEQFSGPHFELCRLTWRMAGRTRCGSGFALPCSSARA